MRLSTRLALAALLAFPLLVPPAAAQDGGAYSASHLQAARDMLRAAGTPESMTTVIDQQLDVQVEQNPALLPFRDVMAGFMAEHLSYEALEGGFVDAYVRRFTEAELRELTRFYQTETGQKAARLSPALMAEGMALGQQAVADHQADLEQRMHDRMAQLGMEAPEPVLAPGGEPPAAPGVVLASDPASVMAALQAAGYPAEQSVDGVGDPMLRVEQNGLTWIVYFYNCTRNADCQSLQFAAGFDFDEPVEIDLLNAWNTQSRFSKALLHEDGSVLLQYDLAAYGAGLDGAYVGEIAAIWEGAVGAFAQHVGW